MFHEISQICFKVGRERVSILIQESSVTNATANVPDLEWNCNFSKIHSKRIHSKRIHFFLLFRLGA